MSLPLLVLRPQPGNDETAARARALGLDAVQIPLFDVMATPPPGKKPEGPFDALLLTSANGVRFGGRMLANFADLPLFAVGAATAKAAREAGHDDIIVGAGDADSTAAMAAAAGNHIVLHICGAQVRPFDLHGLNVTRHVVYRAIETDAETVRPLLDPLGAATAIIHSPRAGRRLAELIDPAGRARIGIAAISTAAAAACGPGWAQVAVSETTDDTALLRVAEALCSRSA